MTGINTITEETTKTRKSGNSRDILTIQQSDVQILMDHHDLSDDARRIIEKENLIPTSLLSRLHNNYPQHSG
ncbi:hypothetical protein ACFLU5_07090, partial [Bacteroidota bacterium]